MSSPPGMLLGFPGLPVMMHWGHQRAPKEFKPELYAGLASALAGNATCASSNLIVQVGLRGQWQGQCWVLQGTSPNNNYLTPCLRCAGPGAHGLLITAKPPGRTWNPLILITTHVTTEETEAQRRYMTCPKLQRDRDLNLRQNTGLLLLPQAAIHLVSWATRKLSLIPT